MTLTVSNPRDLLVLQLGEILHVERRLAGGVLQSLIDATDDEELAAVLQRHLAQTHTHVERVETVFRRIEVAPSALLSRPFESAVAQHDDLTRSIVEPRLADLFHTLMAFHTEHWEIAAYTVAWATGRAMGLNDQLADLHETIREEERARDALSAVADDLARRACARP